VTSSYYVQANSFALCMYAKEEPVRTTAWLRIAIYFTIYKPQCMQSVFIYPLAPRTITTKMLV
jgi:hypothetical protein